LAVGAALALLAGLAACSTPAPPPGEAAPSPPRGGTVVIGIPNDIDHLNPYLSILSQTRDVAYHVYASLLEEGEEPGQGPVFSPALARSWSFSPDGLDLTFDLRPEARWSDGTPITAEDVRFSWQAATDPDLAWSAFDVKRHIEDVRVAGPHTAVFRFTHAYPYQLMDANDGVILPRHIWAGVPFKEWRTARLDRLPVGSGPFKVKEWIPNQSLELVRNEHYWDPSRPRLDRIVLRILPDASTGVAQLEAGEIDFWDRIAPREVARLQASPKVSVTRYADRFVGFIAWNLRRPPFDDPTVRRALTLGINRRRLVDDLLLGTGQVASGPLTPLSQMGEGIDPHPFDPEQAAALLAAAGWTDRDGDGWRDRNGVAFAFELDVNAESALRQDIAVMVQDDLKRLGIEARIVSLERNTANARHREGRFDGFIGGWRLATKVDLATLFHSRSIDGGLNLSAYASERLDAVLEAADQAPDLASAAPLFQEALGILHADQPCTFLYWQDRLVGFSRRVRDARPNSQTPLFNLYDWWVAAPEEP
jgi:peptide/nickel transport system substrate-binding protein